MTAVLRGRLDAVTGMGAGMGAVVLLSPIVHPWYLLWAVIPLAATRAMPVLRRAILAISAFMALVVPPTGADFNFRVYQLPMAILAGLVMMTLMLLVTRQVLAGRTGIEVEVLPGRMSAAPAADPRPDHRPEHSPDPDPPGGSDAEGTDRHS
jgi:alpha-1,6-mannosyltransferase